MSTERAPVRFWTPETRCETRIDGSILVHQDVALGPFARCMSEKLVFWAEQTPTQIWLAERGADGAWHKLSYADGARLVRAVGESVVRMGLGPTRPVLILSGNSMAHAVMAMGAQHVGVPSAAIAPAYSLSGGTFEKLRAIASQITPGAIFVDDAGPYADAIRAVFDPSIPVIAKKGKVAGFKTLGWTELTSAPPTELEALAHTAVTPETVAKFLFTSGTTGSPKAVTQTHGMLTSNQQMVRQCFAFFQDTPPVVVDWAPWNHTASGNKVFNMVLYNGGTYYIDDGRPTPSGIQRTIENLRDVSPTWYFNVPLGFQMLLDAFETDAELRLAFFRDLQMLYYAGAGMSKPVWDRILRLAQDNVPGGVLMTTGFGSTETGPFAIVQTEQQAEAGNLGVPAPGVTLKLVPQGDKLEVRVKSPSITPGYWKNDALTADAFDEDGFYAFGDALKFAVPGDASKGFLFDGRLAENFKLASGTWVAVGPLRAVLTNALGGLASDVVIAGEGHTELGALVVPNWSALRDIAGDTHVEEALLNHPDVRRAAQTRLAEHVRNATGSASRVTRIIFMSKPLDFDKGEVTDKGSINQRAVLQHRADLVNALWRDDPRVIGLEAK